MSTLEQSTARVQAAGCRVTNKTRKVIIWEYKQTITSFLFSPHFLGHCLEFKFHFHFHFHFFLFSTLNWAVGSSDSGVDLFVEISSCSPHYIRHYTPLALVDSIVKDCFVLQVCSLSSSSSCVMSMLLSPSLTQL